MTPDMNSPANRIPYFTVTDIDATLKKREELCGSVAIPTKEISVGKIAVVANPAGAHFTIIEMNV